MNILITGAFGNVGQSILKQLKGHNITILELKSKRYFKKFNCVYGDIRDTNLIKSLVDKNDVIIHLAAIIPPVADEDKERTWDINFNGTKNIVDSIKNQKLIFASSIAVYGDRLNNPYINVEDELRPNNDDEYAKTKIACEEYIKQSGINYSILRLSYIVWKKKLKLDSIMFKMPPSTKIETCDTKDAAQAFIHAIDNKESDNKIFNIAGGIKCRTTFREYLDKMMHLFGMFNSKFLKDEYFSKKGYHCGYMNTTESQSILKYQEHTLDSYYKEVKKESWFKRIFAWSVFLIIRKKIISLSPFRK